MHFSVAIVGALIGIVILFFGRKLFWLCVAAVGFAAGVEIAPHLVHEPSSPLILTVALFSGFWAVVLWLIVTFKVTLITWLFVIIVAGQRRERSATFRFGALFALLLQNIAIAGVAFLAGGKLAAAIAAAFFVHYSQHSVTIFLIGGVISAILLLIFSDWALIVLSSLVGAHLIESAIVLPTLGSIAAFIGLALVGVFVQAASTRESRVPAVISR